MSTRKLAEKIAKLLFTDGRGAAPSGNVRLVSDITQGVEDRIEWYEGQMVSQIEKVLLGDRTISERLMDLGCQLQSVGQKDEGEVCLKAVCEIGKLIDRIEGLEARCGGCGQ